MISSLVLYVCATALDANNLTCPTSTQETFTGPTASVRCEKLARKLTAEFSPNVRRTNRLVCDSDPRYTRE